MKFHISQVYQALATCSACPIGAELKDGQLVCNHDGNLIEFMENGYACPLGKWSSKITADLSKLIHVPEKKPPKKRGVWNSIKNFWQQADEKITELSAKAGDFTGAVFSGFAEPEIVEERKKSCFGTEIEKPCENLIVGRNGYKYCGACGCGEWALARLDGAPISKLMWKNLPCPLAKKGFTNYEGDINAH